MLVGSVVTGWTQLRIASRRADFEASRARHERLQRAYADLITAAHRTAISGIIRHSSQAEAALIDEISRVQLLAPSDTYEAARILGRSVIRQRYEIDKKPVPTDYEDAAQLEVARGEFLRLAKRDLGLEDAQA